jgi:hypothetical protein
MDRQKLESATQSEHPLFHEHGEESALVHRFVVIRWTRWDRMENQGLAPH